MFKTFFAFGYSCFMILLWLEIHDDFLWIFFLLFNLVTSAVTAYKVNVSKKTWGNTRISIPHHRNQFQTSIKFSLKFKSWIDVVIGYFFILFLDGISHVCHLLNLLEDGVIATC